MFPVVSFFFLLRFQCVYLSIYLSIYLFVCLPDWALKANYLSISVSVCLSVCLWSRNQLLPYLSVLHRNSICIYIIINSKLLPTARVGLMHIGVFILLLLSGERNFGVRLNKPYSVRVPMDIPVFTGTHADFLIIVSAGSSSSAYVLW